MTHRLATLACAGLVAAATPAVAAEIVETTRYYVVPAATETHTYYVPSATDRQTYYYVTEGPAFVARAPVSVTEVAYEEPAIVVEAPRLTEDERITNDVVDVLAGDPYLSGRIGVQTHDRDVHLSGVVATPGQVHRAVRNAGTVAGVDHVSHELRPRVGANTYYY